ncbi:MAG TPA: site-2 protease family protein [Nitrospiraceae bacterium]|nr:site-2 protease family protein [Nitrospiraceae bacterium]
MIGQSLRITTIRGIEVGLHYSWFIIFFLITFSLTTRFASEHPHWTTVEHYTVAIATSLLFFASIFLHELAHSFVALAKGIHVRSITLFAFGGVAQIGREPDRPLTEFQIAIAGPIASALLAVGFWFVSSLAGDQFEHVAALGGWLASINLMLAVFNLVPGFPLDGGRILRAILWHVTGSFAKATRTAARSGQIIGYGLIVGGIWTGLVTGNWFSGLWLAFIGWFLRNAAQESVLQMSVRSALGGLVAEDIMARDCPTVPSQLSLADLVQEHILRMGRRCFLVSQNGRLEGLITLHQVKAIPQERWNDSVVAEAMTPIDRLHAVAPETPITEVLRVMEQRDVNQVPVTQDGRLLGMITRDHLLRVLSANLEMGAHKATPSAP